MTLAVVKWFNDSKGYGFLNTLAPPNPRFIGDLHEAHGQDIFVHYTEIKGTLNAPNPHDGFKTLSEGQLVECEVLRAGKDFKAVNVWKTSEFIKQENDKE